MVNINIVARPSNYSSTSELLRLDESVSLGLLQCDVSIGSFNIKTSYLNPGNLKIVC